VWVRGKRKKRGGGGGGGGGRARGFLGMFRHTGPLPPKAQEEGTQQADRTDLPNYNFEGKTGRTFTVGLIRTAVDRYPPDEAKKKQEGFVTTSFQRAREKRATGQSAGWGRTNDRPY